MADRLSTEKRSWNMSRIKGKDTKFVLRGKIAPEKIPDAKNRLWRFVSYCICCTVLDFLIELVSE